MIYYDRIDLSEGIILIKQVDQKNVIFVAVSIF